MALHLPNEPLKTCSGLEPVLRCEPSPLADDLTTVAGCFVFLAIIPD